MSNYLFPFHTCEIPYNDIHVLAQPYSALVNATISIHLCSQYRKANSIQLKCLFLVYILFEAFHLLSHLIHFQNIEKLQFWIMHCLNYLNCFATLWCIQTFCGKANTILPTIVLVVDIGITLMYQGVWSIITGLALFCCIICCHYSKLPYAFQSQFLYRLLPAFFLLIAALLNESYHCS